MTDLLVRRHSVHGMPVESYVEELRDRLPEHDVRLARTPEEEREGIVDATAVTGTDIDESLLDRAEDLRLFAGMYAGYGHLPMDTLRERDVAVTTASGVHGPNVAEHAVASVLAFVREFPTAFDRQRDHEWRHFQGHELAGSTVTVVGLGAIGQGVVQRLKGFDVTTIGVRRHPDDGGPTDEVVGPDALHDALARTDYLVLACPLTDETRGLVDSEAFGTLPPEAVLVNVARGAVVDTDALVSALRSNEIRGAALDVTDPEPLPADHPLWGLSNVLVTPHNSGHTPNYFNRLADIVAENLQRVEETGRYEDLRNQVA
ncbi:D-2-hydroxyacid dehydrogenase [Halomarina salina]|uniref:D-2-hydroxyacid dehydrogenase n=1 Tax=Halomarina salina TaxID=1872699 RepID=A0ABD5RRQ6_9EURY|nr:D-2-hydroxyacid dehydrogenase [Halomarina salina]